MAGLDADEYALDELTCPITGEIFLDPVLCVGDGHTYERLAAERWLATHATSPLTGQPLEQPEGLTLVENHSVRKQAAALVQRRPELLRVLHLSKHGERVSDESTLDSS